MKRLNHPDGGKANPVFFFGKWMDTKAAENLRKVAKSGVQLFSSVVASIRKGGYKYEDKGSTITKFDIRALDIVSAPSDGQARAMVIAFAAGRSEVVFDKEFEIEETQEVVNMSDKLNEKRQREVEQQLADMNALAAWTEQLEELPEEMRYDAAQALRKAFEERRSQKPSADADTVAEFAYNDVVQPLRVELAKSKMKAEIEKNSQSDKDENVNNEKPTIEFTGTAFENETGLPAYLRPAWDMLREWEQTGDNASIIRGRTGGKLASEVNFNDVGSAPGSWGFHQAFGNGLH